MSTPLDALIRRAREVGVRDDHARAYLADLARAPAPAPRRAWGPWLVGGLAVTAAVVMLVMLLRRAAVETGSPLAVGERVALIAEPGTSYGIARATAGETVIDVERGTVTARLWPGATSHRLVLRGGAIEAVATGTVYSLTVDDRGAASVAVHEGKVAVGDVALVEPGGRWPAAAVARGTASARRLLAAAPPVTTSGEVEPDALGPDAGTVVDVAPERMPPVPVPRDAAPSPNERWRRARLLRGQGHYEQAVAECTTIADASDPTWSPIALVEAARIELGPRTAPERAVVLADRFAREWPAHELAPEARELRCRALRQLGREAECAKP